MFFYEWEYSDNPELRDLAEKIRVATKRHKLRPNRSDIFCHMALLSGSKLYGTFTQGELAESSRFSRKTISIAYKQFKEMGLIKYDGVTTKLILD